MNRMIAILIALFFVGCAQNDFSGRNGHTQRTSQNAEPQDTGDAGDGEEDWETDEDGRDDNDRYDEDDDDDEGEDDDSLAGDGDDHDADEDLDGGEDFSETENLADLDMDEFSIACLDDDELDDPNDTLTMTGAHQIRDFVNDRCETAVPRTGAIHAGPDSIAIVCLLQGYKTPTVILQRKYSSPDDNHIAHWEPDAKTMMTTGAKGWNLKIHTLECRGRLRDKCRLDQAKIDCQ